MYALSTEADNPLEGEWTERGQVETNWESFSLDATIFEHRGTRYLVWAQHDPEIGGNTNLYIAEMDSPWSITGEQVMLTKPEYEWETQGYRVNEGAAVIKKNGRIWMTYSASATDENYAMGLLWADEDADLLDPDAWTKSPEPVMSTSPENDVYGPGHNSFTVSKDGEYDILVYHARPYGNIRGNSLYDPNRQTRMQVLHWDEDGRPIFGEPVPDGPHVFSESSEE
jgi:GH43 family beta-xylosidase